MGKLENQTHAHIEPQPLTGKIRSAPSGRPLELRARHTDGGHKVIMRGARHLELVTEPGLAPVVYTSKRQLLIALTGTDRHWTFERYFRIGRHAPPSSEWAEPSFDILSEWGAPTSPTLSERQVTPKKGGTRSKVTVAPESLDVVGSALVAVSEAEGSEPERGIDLVNRADEVAKLLFAGFGQWIFSSGYDPDDVLQEVYKGLLARNRGVCPWDESKSSFGHYVHMVCRGVLSNYHRKVRRRRDNESPGVMGYGSDGTWAPHDVGESQTLEAAPSVEHEESGMREAQEALTVWLEQSDKAHTQDGKMAMTVLPMVAEGMTRAEIADVLGVSRASVSRGLTYLREQTKLWQADLT